MRFEDLATKQDLADLKALLQQVKQVEPEEILTPDEAAALLKVSRRTLDNWANKRTRKRPLQAYGHGHVVRYLRSECIAYLKAHPI